MRWYGLIAAAALLAAATGSADKQQEELQGTWTDAAAEQDGQPLDRIKGNTLTIEGNRFTIKTKTSDLKGTIELHPDVVPKAMDLNHTLEGRLRAGSGMLFIRSTVTF
jgi:uncharacterized protein (TIGR03067 family)